MNALAPARPEWKDQEPFASLLKGDVKGALAGGEKAMVEIVMVTHAGMTTAEFKTFIVSGGGIEFMRPWAERVYGIPPEQAVGSSIRTTFEMLRDHARARAPGSP